MITYNIVILDGNTNQTVFSGRFFALGNDLELELLATNNTNTTRVYGPDFSDPIIGAYHVESNLLKPNADFRITAEITAIGSQAPQNPIRDTFNLKVMP